MEIKTDVPFSLFTASNVASILRISRSMAYRLIQQRVIASVRINNSVRVRPCDLENYIQKNWTGSVNSSEFFKQDRP